MKGRRDRGMVRTEVQEVSARGCKGRTSSLAPFRSGWVTGWGWGGECFCWWWAELRDHKRPDRFLMWYSNEIKVKKL